MRNSDEVYWSTSLPRDHEALHALDAYRYEWGGLSRAEATRRLLIEWHKLRQGQPIAAWIPTVSPQQHTTNVDYKQQIAGMAYAYKTSNSVARAANRVLDD
ncbi:hypothetical protein [Dictyobacter formicarum]|uniref:Uncharacterized protein n=1 Tax=Dictyobacter formicarum TaxID=2778368 RepID=A0ABQ3VG83_9CHLR|nr:hypothetical protein [Dictyobacter formicarum]GHO84378.1 hypothetical protein KSZ_23840 [Dictyobacter formicarum]